MTQIIVEKWKAMMGEYQRVPSPATAPARPLTLASTVRHARQAMGTFTPWNILVIVTVSVLLVPSHGRKVVSEEPHRMNNNGLIMVHYVGLSRRTEPSNLDAPH